MPMTEAGPAPLIYEVRLAVDRDIAREFDVWLDGHVREMIGLPGFYDARVIPADPSPDGRARRIVRYRLRDRAALDNYLDRHAERMRSDGVERFGSAFSAERDIYPARTGDEETGEHRCPNCGAIANQQFCTACGQEQKDYHVSFPRIAKDFLGDTFNFDSRLFRSLGPLVVRPGFLTREFIEGRRVRYIPPLRLYLFISIVFFALMTTLMDRVGFQTQAGEDVSGGKVIQDLAEETGAADSRSAGEEPDRGNEPEIDFKLFGKRISEDTPLGKRLMRNAERVQQSPALFIRNILENVPLMMFLMLPVYALILRLLYPLADYVYLEHLVFALHVHALYFLVFTGQMILSAWIQPATEYVVDWGPLHFGLGAYLALYPAFAMRRVYRQSRLATGFKYILLGITYWVVLATGIMTLFLATFYWF